MKPLILLFAMGITLLSHTSAAETQKPLVSMTVKRHLMDSEHDTVGIRADTSRKDVTLRITITNTSSSTIENAELSADVLVKRGIDEHEKTVKELLRPMKLPTMKPNERITVDLGRIRLNEVEWRHRKFEETLEEWKVVCKKSGTEIGQSLSNSRFTTLEKESVSAETLQKRPMDPRLKNKNKIFTR